MYTAYVDGKLLFSTALEDEEHIILSPKLNLDINGAGSFSFVLPPGNLLYNSIQKLKSIITVKLDDEIIFRGRALDDEKDFYNQKNVYCEGDRSFLLDSLHKPYRYSGNVQEFFRQLVSNHNAQVDEEKQFTVGIITAVSSTLTMEAEDDDYVDTSTRMEDRLLSAYGGWLRTRTEGGITYLDWLTTAGDADTQEVEFSVNLLDLKDKIDASDVFTILIPLGASEIDDDGNYTDPLTVASVNGGLDYIQDDAAVALYGKIWRTQTWAYEDDPSKLLEKGQEFLKTGIAVQSLTLQFIDMHFTDSSKKRVWIGDHPHILSDPHGLDIAPICAKASIDPLNPEKSTYTFGEAPKALTDNFIEAEEDLGTLTGSGRYGGGGGVKKDLEAKMRWAYVQVLEEEAKINLLTGDINDLTGRTSTAEIRIDGLEADILLKADRELVNDLETRITNAEIDIDGANANILMKADSTIVDALGTRVNGAEIEIDGLNSEITLKADKVYVDAEITEVKTLIAEEIEAAKGEIENAYLATVSTNELFALEFVFAGDNVSKTTIPVVTGISGGVASSTDVTFLTTDVGSSYTVEAGTADPVYSDGVQARFVQGPEYTGTLYQPGESRTIVKAGNRFDTALYYGGSSKTVTRQGTMFGTALFYGGSSVTYNLRGSSTDYNLYRTSSVSVTVQGSEYTSTVYTKSGDTYTMVTIPLFRQGSSKTYYTRTLYASAGDLYESGGSVTVTRQGSEYTGTLYEPGSSFTYTEQGSEYTGTLYEPGGSETIMEQGEMYTGALFTQGTEYSGGLYTNFEPATLTIQEITALTA